MAIAKPHYVTTPKLVQLQSTVHFGQVCLNNRPSAPSGGCHLGNQFHPAGKSQVTQWEWLTACPRKRTWDGASRNDTCSDWRSVLLRGGHQGRMSHAYAHKHTDTNGIIHTHKVSIYTYNCSSFQTYMYLVKLLYFTGRGSKFIFQGMELSKVVVI